MEHHNLTRSVGSLTTAPYPDHLLRADHGAPFNTLYPGTVLADNCAEICLITKSTLSENPDPLSLAVMLPSSSLLVPFAPKLQPHLAMLAPLEIYVNYRHYRLHDTTREPQEE